MKHDILPKVSKTYKVGINQHLTSKVMNFQTRFFYHKNKNDGIRIGTKLEVDRRMGWIKAQNGFELKQITFSMGENRVMSSTLLFTLTFSLTICLTMF